MEGSQLKPAITASEAADMGQRLLGRVRRLRTGMRFVLGLELLLVLFLLLFGGGLLGLLFILYAMPRPSAIWAFTLIELAVIGYFFWKWVFSRRRRQLSNLAMAAWIERAIPALSDCVITAVEFTDGLRLESGSAVTALYEPDYLSRFFQQADDQVRRTTLSRVLLRRRLLTVLGVLAVFVLLFENSHYFTAYTASDLRKIYLDSHGTLLRGLGDTLVVEPGDVQIARGEDLLVKAYSVRPGRTRNLELYFRSGEQPWESAPMNEESEGAYRFQFQRVAQELDYFVTDGQSKSKVYRIRLLERPELASLRVTLRYPPYTGLGSLIGQEGEGGIEALVGTGAEVFVAFRQEMDKVALWVGWGEPGMGESEAMRLKMAESSGGWVGKFPIEQSGWYRIVPTTPEGSSAGKEYTYPIMVLEDEKPSIQITYPEGPIDFYLDGEAPAPVGGGSSKLPVRYRAEDDFGISRIELHYAQEGGYSGHRLLAEYGSGEKQVSDKYQWDLEPFWGKQPVVYFLRIYDRLGAWEESQQRTTEHFGESGRLALYWGRGPDSPKTPASQATQASGQPDEDGAAGEGSEQKGSSPGDDLNALADQVAQMRQEQKQVNQAANQQSETDNGTSSEQAQRLSQRQGQVAEQTKSLRQEMTETAREIEEYQKAHPEVDNRKPKGEFKDQKVEGLVSGNANRPGVGPRNIHIPGKTEVEDLPGGPRERDKIPPPPEPKDQDALKKLAELAAQLQSQIVDKSAQGIQTRSGIEGKMRLNEQRLAQRRFKEAGEEGQEIEGQLEQIEQQLREMAQGFGSGAGGEQDEEAEPSAGRSGEAKEKPGPQEKEMAGMGAKGDKKESEEDSKNRGLNDDKIMGHLGVPAFDDYRPSLYDPPPLTALGKKSSNLGEFEDAGKEEDPFGNAPNEERYPLKYEGLVELYFEALAETGD